MKDTELEMLAMWALTMYDQANTGEVIANLSSRAELLDSAMEDLRRGLTARGTTEAIGTWRQR